jgi:hypothetical protein
MAENGTGKDQRFGRSCAFCSTERKEIAISFNNPIGKMTGNL